HGRGVKTVHAAVGEVGAAANALAGAAAGARSSTAGLVVGDRAVQDRERCWVPCIIWLARDAIVEDAAAEAVAAVDAGSSRAADSLVAGEGTFVDGEDGAHDVGHRPTQPVATPGPRNSLAADGLVAREGAACDRGR